MARSTRCAVSSSCSTRARSTRLSPPVRAWPAAALATSSSAKNGLPSARRAISAAVPASVGAPSMPETSSSHGVVGERGELDVLEPRDARPHGERLVEGVAAVEVVGAVGHDETDRPW